MGILKEFKEFANRGNVLDMAVGVIVGGAFGKIITSFVNDILMPPIGLALGDVDFSKMEIVLKEATEKTAAITIKYGTFLNTVIDFLIVAFCIFLVVKGVNAMKKKQEEAPATPPAPSNEEVLLTEIRDLLKNK